MTWNFDRPIRLVKGEGSEQTGACWMSAISRYSGQMWTDHPDCVCSVIRAACIRINDSMPDDETRGRIIGPYLFEPVGTRTDDREVVRKRQYLAVDRAVRVFVPIAMEAVGKPELAAQLRALPEIVDAETASSSRPLLCTCKAASSAAADAADTAAYAAYYAYAASSAYAADAAARSLSASASKESRDRVWELAVKTVVDMCAIGRTTPIELDPSGVNAACKVVCAG